jgi:hypothetical protein
MRIAGSHLHTLMGMEARGMPVTSFFEHECRLRVAGLLEEVFQTPGSADINMYSAAILGQPALEARMILLPLKSDLGDVSRILGCLVSIGQLGTVSRRFDIHSSRLRSPAPEGFAERKSDFGPAPEVLRGTPTTKRPAYLRLVRSEE